MFSRAPPEELEPKPQRSSTKQNLIVEKLRIWIVGMLQRTVPVLSSTVFFYGPPFSFRGALHPLILLRAGAYVLVASGQSNWS